MLVKRFDPEIHRKRPYRRPIRILLIALAVGLALVVGTARAATPNTLCLHIQTLGPHGYLNDAFLNVQTHQVSVTQPPPTTQYYPTPTDREQYYPYYEYSPDGRFLAEVHDTDLDTLIVTAVSPPREGADWPYVIIDNEPPVTFSWSPDSRWVAVHGYKDNAPYLLIADSTGKRLQRLSFDRAQVSNFAVGWSGDSNYALLYVGNGNTPDTVTLHHMPDWNVIDVPDFTNNAMNGFYVSCFGDCWARGVYGHRRANIALVPGQPNAQQLILLDAAVPSVRAIPIAEKTTDYTTSSIAPNGSYVAVTSFNDSFGLGALSAPLGVYNFDGTLLDLQADVATTDYAGRGRQGSYSYYPDMAWSPNGETLYFLSYAENNTQMQLWAYQPAAAHKQQMAAWSTALSPYGYSFYISQDSQRVMLSPDWFFLATPQLVLPDGKVVRLPTNSRSSDWSPDGRYIAIGTDSQRDYNGSKFYYRHTLVVTLLDPNGNRITDTTLHYEDEYADFTLSWTTCP